MSSAIVGTWKIDASKSEDGEAFLRGLGIPADVVEKMNPSETITKIEDAEGGKFRATVSTPGLPEKTHVFGFGETVEAETPVGMKIKATMVDNGGGKFTDTTIDPQGNEAVTVRQIKGSECVATTTVAGKTLNFVMVKI